MLALGLLPPSWTTLGVRIERLDELLTIPQNSVDANHVARHELFGQVRRLGGTRRSTWPAHH